MSIRVDVWSDFVCPFCYAASLALKELEQSHDIEVIWHSYELRPKGSPPMPAEYRERIKASQPQVGEMIRDNFGVDVRFGPLETSSRLALIADKYAEAQGVDVGKAFHAAVNHAYWIDGENIGDVEVLKRIGQQVGLDADGLVAALSDPRYEAEVDADVQQANEYGLRGVPALIFENRYLVSGFRPTATLEQVVSDIRSQMNIAR